MMATEEKTKQLTGSILTTNNIRPQTEYMGTRRTRVILLGALMDLTEDWLGAFFSR